MSQPDAMTSDDMPEGKPKKKRKPHAGCPMAKSCPCMEGKAACPMDGFADCEIKATDNRRILAMRLEDAGIEPSPDRIADLKARASALRRTKDGKMVSARSKTGNAACSQAMSQWKRTGMTPQIAATLGKCRAQARLQNRAANLREAGKEGMAANLERRAGGQYVTQKERLARANELRQQRANRPATPDSLATGRGTPGRLERARSIIAGRDAAAATLANPDRHGYSTQRMSGRRESQYGQDFREGMDWARKRHQRSARLADAQKRAAELAKTNRSINSRRAKNAAAADAEHNRQKSLGLLPSQRPAAVAEKPDPFAGRRGYAMAPGRGTNDRLARAQELRAKRAEKRQQDENKPRTRDEILRAGAQADAEVNAAIRQAGSAEYGRRGPSNAYGAGIGLGQTVARRRAASGAYTRAANRGDLAGMDRAVQKLGVANESSKRAYERYQRVRQEAADIALTPARQSAIDRANALKLALERRDRLRSTRASARAANDKIVARAANFSNEDIMREVNTLRGPRVTGERARARVLADRLEGVIAQRAARQQPASVPAVQEQLTPYQQQAAQLARRESAVRERYARLGAGGKQERANLMEQRYNERLPIARETLAQNRQYRESQKQIAANVEARRAGRLKRNTKNTEILRDYIGKGGQAVLASQTKPRLMNSPGLIMDPSPKTGEMRVITGYQRDKSPIVSYVAPGDQERFLVRDARAARARELRAQRAARQQPASVPAVQGQAGPKARPDASERARRLIKKAQAKLVQSGATPGRTWRERLFNATSDKERASILRQADAENARFSQTPAGRAILKVNKLQSVAPAPNAMAGASQSGPSASSARTAPTATDAATSKPSLREQAAAARAKKGTAAQRASDLLSRARERDKAAAEQVTQLSRPVEQMRSVYTKRKTKKLAAQAEQAQSDLPAAMRRQQRTEYRIDRVRDRMRQLGLY